MLIIYRLIIFFSPSWKLYSTHLPNYDNSNLNPLESLQHHHHRNSYKILAPKQIEGVEDGKKVGGIIIESVNLGQEQYRLGVTKAWSKFSNSCIL